MGLKMKLNHKRLLTGSVVLWSLALLLSGHQFVPRFLPDDPIRSDPDDLPVPMPAESNVSQIFDFLENTFLLRPDEKELIPPAMNVNTLNEVPDSSWYTNRMSSRVMSIEELRRGPNLSEGPDLSEPWKIVDAKSEGITPGFTIRDSRGDVYFIKFDPPDSPQLATSAEVIATKFFYAFGYFVPENYLTYVTRGNVIVSPEAMLTDDEGNERRMTSNDVDEIFERVYQNPDGTTPVIASLRLKGTPLGHFSYYGTRSDDANDIIPHEHRRELRGLRLFSAWMNHDDSRSINTLDMYIGEPGGGFVRHYLIDFGSCFGSGSVKPQTKRASHEYIIEWSPIFKSAASLGIWDRPWRDIEYPDLPSIGRFESDHFRPEEWKPEYPNPAFERMLPEDAFWAVRTILRFSDEMVRELVKTGKLENPNAERYLIETLIERRDKIIAHYLPQVSALDQFEIAEGVGSQKIQFVDLGVAAGIHQPSTYSFEWHAFNNFTQATQRIGYQGTSESTSIEIPDDSSPFLVVSIVRQGSPDKQVRVFLRGERGDRQIVGIEREGVAP